MDDLQIIKELEIDNPDLRKERKRHEFLKRSKNMTNKREKNKNLFLTVQSLYSLCEWVNQEWSHDERKELIKDQLKETAPELIDELVDTVFGKKLYSKKTKWKQFKYACKRLCCRFRNNNDD